MSADSGSRVYSTLTSYSLKASCFLRLLCIITILCGLILDSGRRAKMHSCNRILSQNPTTTFATLFSLTEFDVQSSQLTHTKQNVVWWMRCGRSRTWQVLCAPLARVAPRSVYVCVWGWSVFGVEKERSAISIHMAIGFSHPYDCVEPGAMGADLKLECYHWL